MSACGVSLSETRQLRVSVKLFDGQSVWPLVGEMLFVDDKTSPVGVWRDNVRDTVLICVRE